MSIVTLELKDDSDLELLIAFARRLNVKVLQVTGKPSEIKKDPIYWLEELVKLGGVKSISNPSEWQREIRKDRVLDGREEI